MSELLEPIRDDSDARGVAWILSWRQESGEVYWVPLPGQANHQGFVDFYDDPFTMFEADLPDMYVW